VGGTNPSLLRAMQAGAPCAAVDVVFTREVLGETGVFFSKEPGALAEVLARMELAPHAQLARGRAACARATAEYRWDAIAAATATLFRAVLRARREGLGVAACLAEPIYTPRAHAPPQAATADP
jgi:glycosyltransferase involved in cell wall biosynthesis